MNDENGNRCADPKPKIIIENGTAWLRTKDSRLHFIGDREQLFQHAAHALRKLEGWHRREVYQPPDPPSSFSCVGGGWQREKISDISRAQSAKGGQTPS